MNFKLIFLLIITVVFSSCSETVDNKSETNNWKHEVVVNEVIQTTSYTYLFVSENNTKYWISVSGMDVHAGDVLYYNSGLPMSDFYSKELKRTFDKLLLVQVISNDKAQPADISSRKKYNENREPINTGSISSEPPEYMGLVSLTELFTDPESYRDKKITVSGKVVKYNAAILNRNWLHIVDGVSSYDLTITTNQTVELDDDVTFEGIIKLDKDFGSGYKYEIIMEEAIIK